jgi:hypothetical protein
MLAKKKETKCIFLGFKNAEGTFDPLPSDDEVDRLLRIMSEMINSRLQKTVG